MMSSDNLQVFIYLFIYFFSKCWHLPEVLFFLIQFSFLSHCMIQCMLYRIRPSLPIFLSFPLKSTQANWSPTPLQRESMEQKCIHLLPYEEDFFASCPPSSFLSWCRKANHLAWNNSCRCRAACSPIPYSESVGPVPSHLRSHFHQMTVRARKISRAHPSNRSVYARVISP